MRTRLAALLAAILAAVALSSCGPSGRVTDTVVVVDTPAPDPVVWVMAVDSFFTVNEGVVAFQWRSGAFNVNAHLEMYLARVPFGCVLEQKPVEGTVACLASRPVGYPANGDTLTGFQTYAAVFRQPTRTSVESRFFAAFADSDSSWSGQVVAVFRDTTDCPAGGIVVRVDSAAAPFHLRRLP